MEQKKLSIFEKLKLAITKPEKKWYLQTWFICLCFLSWIFIIPLFFGIYLLIKHYINNYHRNIKYGEFDEIDKKIQELNAKAEKIMQEANENAEKIMQETNENAEKMMQETNANAERIMQETNEEIEKMNKDKNIISELNQNSIKELQSKIAELKNEKETLIYEVNFLTKESIIEYGNVSDYSNISSQEIKNNLNMLKLQQDELVKNSGAILITTMQNANNKKQLNSNVKQLLRSFNSECNSIIDKLTLKNIDTSRNKFEKSYYALNKLYELDFVQISKAFYELKLKELTLNYSYIQQVENEKEQQRVIRDKLLEEEKVRKEIEQEKLKLQKEETQFKNEVSKLMLYLNKSNNDVEKQLYIDKIKELEDKLKLLEKDKENVLKREQNTRAGFVYIISNIGSFGENIYKIGMTRRLEPMDRIKELGDASVPFQFDVHALIFSDDAPSLESILHQTFKENQVNKLNSRKEFYNIDLEKIKEVVKNNYNNTVNFTEYAEAYEYRESLKLREK